jgi:hypothetical protein
MGFFNLLMNWFRRLVNHDSPQIPWRLGHWEVESLFENPHTRPLAIFLHTLEPQLLAQWYATVAPSATEARKAAMAVDELCLERNELTAQLAELEAIAAQNCDENPQRENVSQHTYWEWLLTIGLSLMLFLGIAENLRLEVENFNFQQLPLFCLALLGAICLTAGAKLTVIRWVKATRTHKFVRSFYDDDRYAHRVAFWVRIISGDSAVWLSLAIVLLEIAFAAPGLIRHLPINLQKQLLIQVSAYMGTGIAALINVGLAWGTALEEIRSQNEHLQELATEKAQQQHSAWQQTQARKCATQRQAEVTKVALKALTQEIEEKKRFVQDLTNRAQQEHDRWEATVKQCFRRWCNADPKRLERFQQFYSQLQGHTHHDTAIGNGKHPLSTKYQGDLRL